MSKEQEEAYFHYRWLTVMGLLETEDIMGLFFKVIDYDHALSIRDSAE